MLHKTKQQRNRHLRTASNRLPNRRSREFLINVLRRIRLSRTSPGLRGALGFLR